MDARLRRLAARQEDVVAVWQLLAAGATEKWIRHRSAGWREIHDGVYALNYAPLTQSQLWWAASLTTPDSALSIGSAGAYYGFYDFRRSYEVITRPGTGGPR